LLAQSLNFFFSYLALNIFSFEMRTKLGLPHPLALRLSHYICGQPLASMGIHLFRSVHGKEKAASHDAMWDAFASIVKDVGFHVARGRPTFSLMKVFLRWVFFLMYIPFPFLTCFLK
jgi:hypothetical protein